MSSYYFLIVYNKRYKIEPPYLLYTPIPERPDIPFYKIHFYAFWGWFLSEEVDLWLKTIVYLTTFLPNHT